MRKHAFNQMLLALSVFDLLFIVCGVPVHAIPAMGINILDSVSRTAAYAYAYKLFLYPFTAISYSGSVYMTMALTVERCV